MSVRKIPGMADVTKIAVRIIRYNHCERYGLRYETSDEIINDAGANWRLRCSFLVEA